MFYTPLSPWRSFITEDADAVRDLGLSDHVKYWTDSECREFASVPRGCLPTWRQLAAMFLPAPLPVRHAADCGGGRIARFEGD